MQRIGRAGHSVGAISEGIIFPKYRADLVACAAVTRAMHESHIESTRFPRNPLDVLAQQMVAIVARPPNLPPPEKPAANSKSKPARGCSDQPLRYPLLRRVPSGYRTKTLKTQPTNPVPSTPSTTYTGLVRSAAPFGGLTRTAFEGVLDLLAGRYPSDEFAELRPRLTWDRIRNVVTARQGATPPRHLERRHHPRSRPLRRLSLSRKANPSVSANSMKR